MCEAISHALGRLRREFDDQLFVRHGSGLVPTALSHAIIEPVRSALVGIDVAIAAATRFEVASQVITGQTATQVLMATGDHMTAKWGVDLIGTVEVENQRPSESLSTDPKADRGSLSTMRDRKTLIIDADLTGLKTGEAFLRLSGYPIAQVKIDPGAPIPAIAPAFIPAPSPARVIPDRADSPSPTRAEDRPDWLDLGGPF